MSGARRTIVAVAAVTVLAATAAVAAPATDPPPRIAFLANGVVPADALAAGPIAGQLGAPIYTTPRTHLSEASAAGLDAHDPELVIVLGGPVAISESVVDQVASVTGLARADGASPDAGIVRAAGEDRYATARAVADLLDTYAPAHLPVDARAADADRLDGHDADAFLPADGRAADAAHADDADALGGRPADEFRHYPTTVTQPLDVHAYGTESDLTVQRFAGTVRARPTASGTRLLHIALPGTHRRGDARVAQPTEIELCYHVSDAADAITDVEVWSNDLDRVLDVSGLDWDATDLDGTCEVIELEPFTAASSDYSIGMVLAYDATGTSFGHDLFIDSVAVTHDVVDAAAGTSATSSGGTVTPQTDR